MLNRSPLALILAASLLHASASAAPDAKGYYRQPAIHGETIVFVAEGDLWTVPTSGGRATRLTSHAGDEGSPEISPDGQTIAFTAQYEGPTEIYTMPLTGGLPTRRTFDGARTSVQGWTTNGRIIGTTDHFSTLPNLQLFTLDPATGARTLIPLWQASDGAFESGPDSTLFFTRLPFNGSNTKRYKGGTTQNLWKFSPGDKEATPLTADYEGTSKRTMPYKGRVYFLTDRDGTMNIWSMSPEGKDLKQHTHHAGLDVGGGGGNSGANLDPSTGKIVYQLGADLRTYDIAADKDSAIAISLGSDFDQERERWVKKPMDYVTSAHLSPDGDRVALTARGHLFVFPAKQGRMVEATHDQGVRYRNARFLPSGDDAHAKSLVALSDKSGEIELWTAPTNGVGDPAQLTTDGDVIRWDAIPSPDGRYIVNYDKKLRLFVFDTQKKTNTKIDDFKLDEFSDFDWSADSRYLAYVAWADNLFRQIKIWDSQTGQTQTVTTDRFDSYSPAFSRDGKWLYFLSDRNLKTIVESPWGSNQPDPFLDKTTKIYALALKPGERSPFAVKDELHQGDEKKKEEKPAEKKEEKKPAEKPEPSKTPELPVKPELPPKTPDQPRQEPKPSEPKKPGSPAPETASARAPSQPEKDGEKKDDKADDKSDSKKDPKKEPPKTDIDFTNIASRLYDVPVPPGNYSRLATADKTLFYASAAREEASKLTLNALTITNDSPEPKAILSDLRDFELSQDGKKLLIRKADALYIADAGAAPITDLDKKAVDLSGWALSVIPRDEWRQMYNEAWRLERDYFYTPTMHGVNWKAIREKYAPLADRVSTRAELNDVLAQMIGELSTLHEFVRGGDLRQGEDQIQIAALGALLIRDESAGGYRVDRIYQCDPDDPHQTAPLAKPDVDVHAGDIITAINGVPTLSVPDASLLLRNKAGKQVLIHIKLAADRRAAQSPGEPILAERDAIVVPISQNAENDLRYSDWEYSRRQLVEKWSDGKIGYLHLRAMGGGDFTDFVRGFYPVYNRQGLIIDVRHNRGGNIDSWVLSKLMRKPWFFWTQREGNPPSWNMQFAFRGHMCALCNERTASDGEAFSEGFKRLGLGKVIGTRTWGGEVWLSSSNVLVDKGIATAAETGVYGPEGIWLVEGRGVEPDIIVDNLPHATFDGDDAQLKAAVDHLLQLIKEKPIAPISRPDWPDKSFKDNK